MLERAIIQLETAMVDPNFYGVVRQDRIDFYQSEVDRWKGIIESNSVTLT